MARFQCNHDNHVFLLTLKVKTIADFDALEFWLGSKNSVKTENWFDLDFAEHAHAQLDNRLAYFIIFSSSCFESSWPQMIPYEQVEGFLIFTQYSKSLRTNVNSMSSMLFTWNTVYGQNLFFFQMGFHGVTSNCDRNFYLAMTKCPDAYDVA